MFDSESTPQDLQCAGCSVLAALCERSLEIRGPWWVPVPGSFYRHRLGAAGMIDIRD